MSLCRAEVDQRKLLDAMRSFPSGHAQLSCFAAAFTMVYVGRRVGTTYSSLWRPWLQLAAVLLAACCSLSRLADRRHHPWDVAAGAALGGLLGLAAARACLEQGQRWGEGGALGTAASARLETVPVPAAKQKRPSQMPLLGFR